MIADNSLRDDLEELFANYAACVDCGDPTEWPSFFTEDGLYRLVPRENFDRGLPLSTLVLHGRGMMRDRLFGIQNTIWHAPYYQRHIVGRSRIVSREPGVVATETNYLVVRTKRDLPAEVFNVGVYRDRVVSTAEGLKFAERVCVFDNDLIPNSIIYPI